MSKFDKIFKQKTIGESKILLKELNTNLPEKCQYRYYESEGIYVLEVNGAKISGFDVVYPDDFLEINNNEKDYIKLIDYCNNSNTIIKLELKSKDTIFIGGKPFDINKLILNDYGLDKISDGYFCIMPFSFNQSRKFVLSTQEFNKEIIVHKIPNKSYSTEIFKTVSCESFEFTLTINKYENKISYSIYTDFTKASSLDEAILNEELYNSFINKTLLINNVCIGKLVDNNISSSNQQNHGVIELLNKLKAIIGCLNLRSDVSLNKFSINDVYTIDLLYSTLINKIPVKTKNNTSLTLTFIDKPSKPVGENTSFALSYWKEENIKFFDVEINLYKFILFLNCVYGEEFIENKEYKVKLLPFNEKGIDEHVMLYATEKEVLDLNMDNTFLEYMANSAVKI